MPNQPNSKENIHPANAVIPRRRITGMSAILLPFLPDNSVDWKSFDRHVERTLNAGLSPAVNMDTGYANLIDAQTRKEVLIRTQNIAGGKMYVAGAYVADSPGADFDLDRYSDQIDLITRHGGTPIIFQSFGLTSRPGDAIVEAYQQIARCCDRFIAFELGDMFAPFGKIYDLDTYTGLVQIPRCIGAKHSSLSRKLEWQRLRVRDSVRPDFMVLTGNDLAIDMVMYGSDYLLGLSTFAPDAFALRDKLWQNGDDSFYELNDLLQYLGFLAFRPPVPAYKHSAAQFLHLRQWIATDKTHPNSATRPDTDIEILKDIMERLTKWL
ncbi:MAG: dihydrodipicolinate synthase family protein, partial [Anaerohalosphaera sp.]|nr:dihydrodipicolinate synthase family protein [Anaerohalosphaera sp.]